MLFTPLATIAADDSTKPYIEGYSPVSYFTENRAELGRPEFSVRHRGRTYWLTSKQQVTLFEQDPDKYRPRYDLCPYSLALGKHLPLDPKNFKIVGGSLLLFHRSDQNDGLRGFQQSGLSGEELIRRADANYTLFRFD
jgi:YHS domain-containing protein